MSQSSRPSFRRAIALGLGAGLLMLLGIGGFTLNSTLKAAARDRQIEQLRTEWLQSRSSHAPAPAQPGPPPGP